MAQINNDLVPVGPVVANPDLTPVGPVTQVTADPLAPFKHLAKKVGSTTIKGLTFPIEGMNAVLGAPQRGVAGALAEDYKESKANPQQVIGNPLREIGSGIYGAFHPNDPSVENLAEQSLGVNKLKTTRNDLLGRAQNFAVDTGFQTATDPLTYFGPGIGKHVIGPMLDLAGGAVDATARATKTEALLDFIKPNALVRKKYSGHQLNVYEGSVEAQKAVARKVALNDETLFKESAPYIKALKKNDPLTALPDPLMQRVEQLLSETKVPFPKTGTMQERLDAFFPRAQAAERENRIKATVKAHGLSYVQNPKNIGEALKNVPLIGPAAQTISRIGTGMANAGKNTMFINSLPHMGNVGVAQFLGSGVGGVLGGLGRAVTGKMGKYASEMEKFGVTSHFSAREPSAIERNLPILGPAATKVRAVSQGALDRFETAMRAQRYTQLRKKGMDAFDAAAQVRKELFDYTNTSGMSRLLSEFGSPFAQYRLGAVPMMGLNALRNAPQRLAQYARAENLTNQDLVKSRKYGLEFGKPPDLVSQLGDFSPSLHSGTANYLASPSTIGIPGAVLQGREMNQSIGQQLLSAAAQYVPGVAYAETIANWQKFPSKAPKVVRDILNQLGAYPKNIPKHKKGTVYF